MRVLLAGALLATAAAAAGWMAHPSSQVPTPRPAAPAAPVSTVWTPPGWVPAPSKPTGGGQAQVCYGNRCWPVDSDGYPYGPPVTVRAQ